MQLIVGNFYKTRNGCKVKCVAADLECEKSHIIAIYDKYGKNVDEIRRIFPDGVLYQGDKNCYDIIGEWVEPLYSMYDICLLYEERLKNKPRNSYVVAEDDEGLVHLFFYGKSLKGNHEGVACQIRGRDDVALMIYPPVVNLKIIKEVNLG